jgi:hypothetical protein
MARDDHGSEPEWGSAVQDGDAQGDGRGGDAEWGGQMAAQRKNIRASKSRDTFERDTRGTYREASLLGSSVARGRRQSVTEVISVAIVKEKKTEYCIRIHSTIQSRVVMM